MVCCLLCFSNEPIEGDEKSMRERKFQISLVDAITKGQPCCCISCFCPCCAAYKARQAVIDEDMTKYECCQGYIPGCCCCKPGQMGEQSCPEFCLCLESFCCVGPSISSSRMYIMDKHSLGYDPCDNRMIRFSNCLQILSCVCNILAIFIRDIRELARLIQCLADAVFYSMMGCMSAQIQYEVEFQKTVSDGGYSNYQSTTSPIMATGEPYKEQDGLYYK